MSTRNHNRFISGEDLGTVAGWEFGAVDQASVRFAAKVRAQELAEEQAREALARQAGYPESFTQDHALGTLEGQQQLDE